jgi:hypothetical protein
MLQAKRIGANSFKITIWQALNCINQPSRCKIAVIVAIAPGMQKR